MLLAVVIAVPAYGQQVDPPVTVEEAEVRFDIMEFEVRGNSVFGAAAIERALMPFAGYDKRTSDVEAARTALEAAYREKGFATVVVEVPPQDVRSGIVRLTVAEGRVDQVAVKGARYVLPSEIKRALPEIRTGVVPNVPVLQAQLANANSRPTRTITPEFRAGLAPGTVDIDLVVEDKRPWGASVELNDQYNRSTERLRANASLRYDNLWQAGHSLNLSYQTSPEDFDQIQVFSGSYYAPLGYSRTSLLVYGVQSNTSVATIGGLTVLGNGTTAGARVIHSLGGSPRGVVQSVLFGFDYKDYLDEVGLTDPNTGDVLTFETPVRYLPFTAQFRRFGNVGASSYEVSVGTTFAFDGLVGDQAQFGGRPNLPNTPQDESTSGKRANSDASFVYLTGGANYTRKLGKGWEVRTDLDWQLSAVPLISNEQFVIGGVGSIRGYREAEALGDSGVRASLAVSNKIPLDWLGTAAARKIDLTVAAFAEGGGVFVNRALPGEDDETWLASVGVSSTLEILDLIYGQIDFAYQLHNDPSQPSAELPDDIGPFRAHFKIGLRY